VISAEQMNKNFEYLEQQFRGARATTVDCGTSGSGSGINQAIAQGFNDITISGTCRENINFGLWTNDDFPPNDQQAPGYLRLKGTGSNPKILDASDSTEATVLVDSGKTLILENLTIEGGKYGLFGTRNSNILLSGMEIKNFLVRGINIYDSSYLGVNQGGVNIDYEGANRPEFGIFMATGSSGWIHNININNVHTGITVGNGSTLAIQKFSIDAVHRGFVVGEGSNLLKFGDDDGTISNVEERAILISSSSFLDWDSKLILTAIEGSTSDLMSITDGSFQFNDLAINNSGSDGIRLLRSSGTFGNLNIQNSQKNGIRMEASDVSFNGLLTVENSGSDGLRLRANSSIQGGWWDADDPDKPDYMIKIRNNSGEGIRIGESSSLSFENILVEGNSDGIRVFDASSLALNYALIQNNNQRGIEVSKSSVGNIDETTITGNGIVNSDSALNFNGSSSGYVSKLSISKNNGNGIQVQSSSMTLRNSTISENNGRGLTTDPGAVVDVDNVSITKHPRAGIWGYGARVYIEDSTISENNLNSVDSAGVHVLENAQLNLRKTIVSNNNQDGIHATKGAHVSLYENNMIENNTRNGIYLNNNASVMHGWGSIIRNNQETGLYLSRSSSGDLNQLTIESNQGDGLKVVQNSFVNLDDVTIQLNTKTGIRGSSLSGIEATRIKVNQNNEGIHLWGNTMADFAEDFEIKNNSTYGIELHNNSSLAINQTSSAVIEGNPDGVHLNLSSSLHVRDSTPIIKDKIELGKETKAFFYRSNSSQIIGEFNCWTLFENTDSNSSLNYEQPAGRMQLYNFPVIEYTDHTGEEIGFIGKCGVWRSGD